MKRSESKDPLWQKVTGGRIKLPGVKESIKSGQKIRLPRHAIGNQIRHFELVEGDVGREAPREEPTTAQFEAVHKGGGRYIVISFSGEQMNEEWLSKEEALELAEDLNAEE